MKVFFWACAVVFVGGLVVDLLVARRRRRKIQQQDLSPGWINENLYGRGKRGDDE